MLPKIHNLWLDFIANVYCPQNVPSYLVIPAKNVWFNWLVIQQDGCTLHLSVHLAPQTREQMQAELMRYQTRIEDLELAMAHQGQASRPCPGTLPPAGRHGSQLRQKLLHSVFHCCQCSASAGHPWEFLLPAVSLVHRNDVIFAGGVRDASV